MADDPANLTVLELASRVMVMENPDDVDVIVMKLHDSGITMASDLQNLQNDAMDSKLRSSSSSLTSVEIGHVMDFLKAIQRDKDRCRDSAAIDAKSGIVSSARMTSRPHRSWHQRGSGGNSKDHQPSREEILQMSIADTARVTMAKVKDRDRQSKR